MSRRGGDTVFQLSLTEIVLALAFLLLILLGLMYVSKANEVEELKVVVVESQGVANYPEMELKFAQLKQEIEGYLKSKSVPNADAIIDDLVSVARYEAEVKRLTEQLAKASSDNNSCDLMAKKLESNLDMESFKALVKNQAFLEKVREDLANQGYKFESETALISQAKDNLFEIQRLRRQCGGGAIGPCWVNPQGRTENLLTVTLEQDHVSVEIADLSPARAQELQELPGIDLATRPIIAYGEFERSFGPILQWSKARNPECRHYVAIRSNVPLTRESTPRRMQVQNYFYPDETKAR
jgi:hypothetical protein